MSQEPLVTEELIYRQTPEAQAIIRILLAKIAELEARLNKSPWNSSLPPSTQHPHAKPAPAKTKSGKPGWATRPCQARAVADTLRAVCGRHSH
ncbi:MAG: DUF6444 domain-containing protein [Pirellulales bacterium]